MSNLFLARLGHEYKSDSQACSHQQPWGIPNEAHAATHDELDMKQIQRERLSLSLPFTFRKDLL